MQMFYVHKDPIISAKMLCDKHVVKMPTESTQILCTVLGKLGIDAPYRETHRHHPCVLWAGSSLSNYQWLYNHALALCMEYTRRYGKVMLTESKLISIPYSPPLIDIGFTEPPQAFHEHPECMRDNPIDGYRELYIQVKSKFAVWKHGDIPKWYLDGINNIKFTEIGK